MGKGSVPSTDNDEFFPGLACTGCRAVVQSAKNLTGIWTIVVRGGRCVCGCVVTVVVVVATSEDIHARLHYEHPYA